MIVTLQTWIHRLEEGGGARLMKGLLGGLAFVLLAVAYQLRDHQNFTAPAAMDQAQLARNLAQGKGYTTDVIRPLDLHVLQTHRGDGTLRVDLPQPDIANAPGYPWLLSRWFLLTGARFALTEGDFATHPPEILANRLNQLLFLFSLVLLFRLARRLFDDLVAWLTVLSLGGADLCWQFSQAGLSTWLVMFLVLAAVSCLATAEQGAREQRWPLWRTWLAVALGGALLGLAGLTRYSALALLLPTGVYLFLAFEQRRVLLLLTCLVAAGAVVAPWLQRNFEVSGRPFGSAGHALYQDSSFFPGDRLPRSLYPVDVNVAADLGKYGLEAHGEKFWRNLTAIVGNDLPKLGGSWLTAFFLAGLLLPFQRPGLARLRLFTGLSLAVLVVVQALGRTGATGPAPEVNEDNLLVLAAPLVFLFGAALLSVLLDQFKPAYEPGRGLVEGAFVALFCLPAFLNLATPRPSPSAYPPYHPPVIRDLTAWLQPGELLMTDMPWATAWYGGRTSLWLPRDYAREFADLHRARPVSALYLTSLTIDRKLLSEMWGSEEDPWAAFALNSLVKQELPDGFPLRHAYAGWFPQQIFLADRPRW